MGQDDLGNDAKSHSLKETQVLNQLDTLSSGTVLIGRFEIEAKQGCGRFGCVYKAHDLQLDTPVAVKVLHSHLLNEQALKHFKNEILTLRQLSHPNIVRVHEYYHDDDVHFITMDWIEGQTLAEMIETNVDLADSKIELPRKQLMSYARQILAALEVTEQKGIVHRDLKPENILVDDNEQIYIADFGVAAALEQGDESLVSGTPVYSAPEYLESGQANTTTDIYSFGVLFHEILTAHLPFDAMNYQDLLAQKKKGITGRLPKSQYRFQKLLEQTLAPSQRNRPQSIAAVLELLEYQPRDSKSGKNSWLWIAAGVVILVGAAALTFWNSNSDTAQIVAEEKTGADSTVAVLPFQVEAMASQSWIEEGIPSLLSQKLSQSPGLRVVGIKRVNQTLDMLGYKLPLNESRLLTLSDLLQTNSFLNARITLSGPDQYHITAELFEVVGNQISTTQLTQFTSSADDLSRELATINDALYQHFSVTVLTEAEPLPKTLSLKQWSDIESLIQNQQFERAIEQLEKVTAEFPDFAQGWFMLGRLNAQINQPIAAGDALQRAKALVLPSQLIYQQVTAEQQLLADDLEGATATHVKILEQLPKRDDIRFELAQLYIQQEMLGKAEQELNSIVEQDPNHPSAWYELSKVAIWKGDTEKAVDDYLVKALVTAKKLKNEQLKGDVLNAFGVAYHRLGELDLSLDYYQQGLAARRAINDSRGVVTSLSNVASIYAIKGDYMQAEAKLVEALEVNKPRNDALKQADLYNELGVIAEEQGLYQKALEHFRASLSIRMKLNDDWLKAESLNNVAYIYFLLSDEEHATIYWDQAKGYYGKVQDPVGVIRVNENIGQLQLRKGDWQSAYQIFSKAKEESENLGLFEEKIVADAYLAKIALLKGNLSEPLGELQNIKESLEQRNDVRGQVEFGLWLADWYTISGDYAAAEESLSSVQPLIAQEHNKSQRLLYDVAQARLALYQGLLQEDSSQELSEIELNDENDLTSKSLIALLTFKLERLAFSGERNDELFNRLVSKIESYDLQLHQFANLRLQQLKAAYYIKQGQLESLTQVIEQLQQMQRELGSHWSDFLTNRLLANYYLLKNEQEKASQALALAIRQIEELLKQLPEEQKQHFISLQGRYPFADQFMEKLYGK